MIRDWGGSGDLEMGIPFQYQDPLSLRSLDLWKGAKLYLRFLQNKPSSALNGTSE